MRLDGLWRFRLDRQDAGIRERWFEQRLPDRISLPGSLPEQGIGDAVTTDTPWTGQIVDDSWFTAPEYAQYRQPGNIQVPFWLQPDTNYAGAVWYQRDIEIPADWHVRRRLSLRRTSTLAAWNTHRAHPTATNAPGPSGISWPEMANDPQPTDVARWPAISATSGGDGERRGTLFMFLGRASLAFFG